jgi:hypothetical protein
MLVCVLLHGGVQLLMHTAYVTGATIADIQGTYGADAVYTKRVLSIAFERFHVADPKPLAAQLTAWAKVLGPVVTSTSGEFEEEDAGTLAEVLQGRI